jgi:hypothetical protein
VGLLDALFEVDVSVFSIHCAGFVIHFTLTFRLQRNNSISSLGGAALRLSVS